MYFMDDDALRELERLMQSVPNFPPRSHGVILLCRSSPDGIYSGDEKCLYPIGRKEKNRYGSKDGICMKDRIEAGTATYSEILTETMAVIRYPPFVQRLNQYLKESEGCPMDFKNEQHRKVFTEAVQKLDKKNDALMAALYLLTADWKLWNTAKRHIERNAVHFERFRLSGGTVGGYTLYCAAKDLYLGTKNLTIGDLTDADLISPKIFGLVCNGMAIRRFGLGAIPLNQNNESGGI